MRDTKVIMKNGETYCSPLWEVNPTEGWFTLVGVEKKFFTTEVASATELRRFVSFDRIEDVDLLARMEEWRKDIEV